MTTTSTSNFTKRKPCQKIFPKTEKYVTIHQKLCKVCWQKTKASMNDPSKVYRSELTGVLFFQVWKFQQYYLVKVVSVSFFRTVSEIEAWLTLWQIICFCLGVHVQVRLVSKLENGVKDPGSIGLNIKGLFKSLGPGKCCYQELSLSRSSRDTFGKSPKKGVSHAK